METHAAPPLPWMDRSILWMRMHVTWTFGLGIVAGVVADAVGVLTYFWMTAVVAFVAVSLIRLAEERSPWVRITALVPMKPHGHNEDGECIV